LRKKLILTEHIFVKLPVVLVSLIIGLHCALLSTRAYPVPANSVACASKADNIERLECYDDLSAEHLEELKSIPAKVPVEEKVTEPRSYLTRSWDLDNKDDELLGEHQSPLKPHHVSYLIIRKSSETNQQPFSPSRGSVTLPVSLDTEEVKFQFSQKAKVLNPVSVHFLGITSFRLWGAYTQQSSWQAFNSGNSSPFRETIYEPELILTMSTGNQYGLKLVNFGYVHQSNGLNSSLSRSWNRMYLQGGWESDTLSGLVRVWKRIPEADGQDDMPDIEDYSGRGDLFLRWAPLDGTQLIGLTLRNNFSLEQNRGFIQLDWATPIKLNQSAKLHVQFTSGYGETLIDYNFRLTTVGLGVSFRDW
jgi:phospholipase A1